MKKQENHLNFRTESVVELNKTELAKVNGGTASSSGTGNWTSWYFKAH